MTIIYYIMCAESMMKEFLESGLQNSQSEKKPNTCEDGCTCEKYGHEVELDTDYEDIIHSHFMSQPETEDHFAYLDKVIIYSLYYQHYLQYSISLIKCFYIFS